MSLPRQITAGLRAPHHLLQNESGAWQSQLISKNEIAT